MALSTAPKSTASYFTYAFAVTAIGLALSAVLGFFYSGNMAGAMNILFITFVLSILEISLSFDNAIVNANKLKTMSPLWQQRFLTWGILIAVFGMRIVFPLAVVAIAAHLGPIDAVVLAATEPDEYGRIMRDAQLPISAFGGTFLMLVALAYFVDTDKDVHWLPLIEAKLAKLATIRGIVSMIVLLLVTLVSRLYHGADRDVFLYAAIWGILTYQITDILGYILDSEKLTGSMAKGGLGAFLYLEVLDASFSFDGVIGAFALTQNIFIIAIGLGIGAMYVRSMTIMLVEKGTLSEFRYLEHGAFYSILVLSAIMFIHSFVHVPEWVTGLGGATLIGLSFIASVNHRKNEIEKGHS